MGFSVYFLRGKLVLDISSTYTPTFRMKQNIIIGFIVLVGALAGTLTGKLLAHSMPEYLFPTKANVELVQIETIAAKS